LTPFLVALAIFAGGGAVALAASRTPAIANWVGGGAALIGSALVVVPAARALAGSTLVVDAAWSVPMGRFALRLDPLSAWFLLPAMTIAGLSAIYGVGYLRASFGRRAIGASWLAFNLLVGSIALVLVADNAVLFLVAWECMALSSFVLVASDHERPETRHASFVYLTATHLGTACLLALFMLRSLEAGSFEIHAWAATPAHGALPFVLALIGFGTKAGLVPLHVWLPEAHPAAPSHVSALMSAVMIKTGIYGLLRMLQSLGPIAPWWGYALIAIGLLSALTGALFALAQSDLKRLLAYSSVENLGIVTIGLGVGLLGVAHQAPNVAVLGFAGALLHVVNHAAFKALLFFGAGSVLHATGSVALDRLGGLGRRMPWTAGAFVIGAIAMVGLPPLNGFVSELSIYLASFRGVATARGPLPALLAVIVGLGLVGGLAAVASAKAFGLVFLGQPRHAFQQPPRDPSVWMQIPMSVLALSCLALGLGAPLVLDLLPAPLVELPGLRALGAPLALERARPTFVEVSRIGAILLGLIGALAGLRHALLRGRSVESAPTWDCGYARPTPRMQYTAASFSQPLVELFSHALGPRRRELPPTGPFPDRARFEHEQPDLFERGFVPIFRAIAWASDRMRWLQHGSTHLYVLYVVLTLLALLAWRLRP
jgi:hydrogenase-4 component B